MWAACVGTSAVLLLGSNHYSVKFGFSVRAELGLSKNGAPELDCNAVSQDRAAELGLVKNEAPVGYKENANV